jgi:hypothetical protein
MDRIISRLPTATAQDPFELALTEIDTAIALVVAGIAVTVTLCSLEQAEGAAYTGAAWAQTAGVAFRLSRDSPASVSLVIGPRFRDAPAPVRIEARS